MYGRGTPEASSESRSRRRHRPEIESGEWPTSSMANSRAAGNRST
jgi:hypothetical protein